MRVTYHDDASDELQDAIRFYERRMRGLGKQFHAEIEAGLERIFEAPERWGIIDGDVRAFVLKRFSHSIYYQVRGDEVFVIAFPHHARKPGYWRDRVDQ
jgi:toxin ParE1/3/4